MPTRLVHLVLDANDRHKLADFWAAALGWEKDDDDDEPAVAPPGYTYPDPAALPICFCPVPEPKPGKNRVHLDLVTESAEHYQQTVDRLLALGATRADIGQRDTGWEVLADPEGNEFCVLPPREGGYETTGIVNSVVIDAAAPRQEADFWQLASGWARVEQDEDAVVFRSRKGVGPFLVLLRNPDQKTSKNRMHTDIAPEPGEDHAGAVQRLIEAGAARIDVALAAPDGSEFCVLTPR